MNPYDVGQRANIVVTATAVPVLKLPWRDHYDAKVKETGQLWFVRELS